MGQKGAWLRSRDLLLNFGPLLSLERLKLQNSNFAGGLRLRGTEQRNQKWAKRGVAWVTWRAFKLWNP